MRRDLDPIELPPPGPDYGGIDNVDDDTPGQPGDVGSQPIDNLDLGTDPEHLGAPGEGVRAPAEPDRRGIDERGPVQEPPARDDARDMARSREAKAATAATVRAGEADPSAVDTEPMPVDHKARPVDRDPSA